MFEPRRHRWRSGERWLLRLELVGLVGLIVYLLGPVFGRIEGAVAPVTENFRIATYVPAGEISTRIWGHFDLRRVCDFEGIEWELEGAERDLAVPLTFEGGATDRRPGPQRFGPWRLAISPEQLRRTRAAVWHDCGGLRWWRTRTPLYP